MHDRECALLAWRPERLLHVGREATSLVDNVVGRKKIMSKQKRGTERSMLGEDESHTGGTHADPMN